MTDIIYFNGDSFVAGVELGDWILPEYPGHLDYPWDASPNGPHEIAKAWINKTYTPDHVWYRLRNEKAAELLKIEYDLAFPNKIHQATGINVINKALGGSSMDRIVRTTIRDLIELKDTHKSITAIIGTTHCARGEVANAGHPYINFLDETVAWQCISTTYKIPNRSSEYDPIISYKEKYETTYHYLLNFYKNVIMLKDFCMVNNITLHWVSTFSHVKDEEKFLTPNYNRCEDLRRFIKYAQYCPIIDMREIAKEKPIGAVCPSGHFSEVIHDETANRLIQLCSLNK